MSLRKTIGALATGTPRPAEAGRSAYFHRALAIAPGSNRSPACPRRAGVRLRIAAVSVAALQIAILGGPALGADPAAIKKQLDATAAAYGKIETEMADTQSRRQKLETDLKQAESTISNKAVLVRKRAGYMYKHGGLSFLEHLLVAPNMGNFLRRLFFLEIVGNKDSQLVESLRITQSRADDIRERLDRSLASQRKLAEELREKRSELNAQFKGAQGAAKVGRFGKFSSFTLALNPTGFANTWGARRSGGRRHKGTDLMAPCGAPVFAVTDGVISNLHSGGNGGIMLYLRAANGDVFFYAHLRRYAPGIQNGVRVRTGQVIAYNGNTGNARGGACHVHFEWHPGGGRAVNPYPILAAVR